MFLDFQSVLLLLLIDDIGIPLLCFQQSLGIKPLEHVKVVALGAASLLFADFLHHLEAFEFLIGYKNYLLVVEFLLDGLKQDVRFRRVALNLLRRGPQIRS